jgi:ribosomal-protein-alanine N-acetyltransferase
MAEHLIEKVREGRRLSFKASRLAFGSLMAKKWNTFEDANIIRVNNDVLDDVLRLYTENFTEINEKMFLRYCRFFNEMCYVFLEGGKVKGYSIFFLKPVLSFTGINKTAVLYSFAVDSKYRNHGIGRRLLQKGIHEMGLNSVGCISLFVAVDNLPAISLYRKMGFKVTREVDDVCGPGLRCYEMSLRLRS